MPTHVTFGEAPVGSLLLLRNGSGSGSDLIGQKLVKFNETPVFLAHTMLYSDESMENLRRGWHPDWKLDMYPLRADVVIDLVATTL